MATTRLKALVGGILALAFLQVTFENVVVFLGATGQGSSGSVAAPYVLVGVPLLISLVLLCVLVGGAIWTEDVLR